MKTKTMQELADFFDEPIEIYNGNVVFSKYMDVIISLEMVDSRDYAYKNNGYNVIPNKEKNTISNKRIIDYLNNCDIGASSKTMLIALLGGTPKEVNYPHDNGDFGRCYEVFEYFPELYNNIDNVSKLSDEWKYITDIWKIFGFKFCKENIDNTSFFIDVLEEYNKFPFDKKTIDNIRKILRNRN